MDELVFLASAPLRQVADTPRLYRRTNRSSPANHQTYISNTVNVLTNFLENNTEKVKKELIIKWLTEVCNSISEQ